MTEVTDKPKYTIDGKEYVIEDLPQEALNQLASINIVDRKITDQQQEIGIFQTARNAYAAALAAALPKN